MNCILVSSCRESHLGTLQSILSKQKRYIYLRMVGADGSKSLQDVEYRIFLKSDGRQLHLHVRTGVKMSTTHNGYKSLLQT